ncbi:hypothetical protein BKA70DRAFT_1304272, partial [Coprinopsis sp. MPI-PUGE-AT-0042]
PCTLAAAQGLASVRANVVLVGGALLLAEFFDTFESEVELIWPSNWSIVKVVILCKQEELRQRIIAQYSTDNFVLNPKPLTCQIMFGMLVLGICTSIIISEVLLYLRLYALSGRKRWALILLACNVTVGHILCYWVRRGKEVEGVSGCRTIHASNLLVVMGYTTLLYSGLTAMVLSIFFGVRAYWASRRSPLLQVFYRDGTFYFIVLAVMSVGNGISAFPGYRYIMGPLQAVMHSTLSTRMVLRLKAQAKHGTGYSISATTDSSGPRSLGSLHFREDTYLFSSPFQLQTTNRNRQLP